MATVAQPLWAGSGKQLYGRSNGAATAATKHGRSNSVGSAGDGPAGRKRSRRAAAVQAVAAVTAAAAAPIHSPQHNDSDSDSVATAPRHSMSHRAQLRRHLQQLAADAQASRTAAAAQAAAMASGVVQPASLASLLVHQERAVSPVSRNARAKMGTHVRYTPAPRNVHHSNGDQKAQIQVTQDGISVFTVTFRCPKPRRGHVPAFTEEQVRAAKLRFLLLWVPHLRGTLPRQFIAYLKEYSRYLATGHEHGIQKLVEKQRRLLKRKVTECNPELFRTDEDRKAFLEDAKDMQRQLAPELNHLRADIDKLTDASVAPTSPKVRVVDAVTLKSLSAGITAASVAPTLPAADSIAAALAATQNMAAAGITPATAARIAAAAANVMNAEDGLAPSQSSATRTQVAAAMAAAAAAVLHPRATTSALAAAAAAQEAQEAQDSQEAQDYAALPVGKHAVPSLNTLAATSAAEEAAAAAATAVAVASRTPILSGMSAASAPTVATGASTSVPASPLAMVPSHTATAAPAPAEPAAATAATAAAVLAQALAPAAFYLSHADRSRLPVPVWPSMSYPSRVAHMAQLQQPARPGASSLSDENGEAGNQDYGVVAGVYGSNGVAAGRQRPTLLAALAAMNKMTGRSNGSSSSSASSVSTTSSAMSAPLHAETAPTVAAASAAAPPPPPAMARTSTGGSAAMDAEEVAVAEALIAMS